MCISCAQVLTCTCMYVCVCHAVRTAAMQQCNKRQEKYFHLKSNKQQRRRWWWRKRRRLACCGRIVIGKWKWRGKKQINENSTDFYFSHILHFICCACTVIRYCLLMYWMCCYLIKKKTKKTKNNNIKINSNQQQRLSDNPSAVCGGVWVT